MTYILELQSTDDEDRSFGLQASTLSVFICAGSTLSITFC